MERFKSPADLHPENVCDVRNPESTQSQWNAINSNQTNFLAHYSVAPQNSAFAVCPYTVQFAAYFSAFWASNYRNRTSSGKSVCMCPLMDIREKSSSKTRFVAAITAAASGWKLLTVCGHSDNTFMVLLGDTPQQSFPISFWGNYFVLLGIRRPGVKLQNIRASSKVAPSTPGANSSDFSTC